MAEKTLQQLTRAYAQGELDKENYRKARASLINDILSGEVEVPDKTYPTPIHPRAQDNTFEEVTERKLREDRQANEAIPEPGARRKAAPPPPEEPVRNSTMRVKTGPLLAGLAVVIVLPVLIYFLLPASSTPDTDQGGGETAPDESATSSQAAASSEASDLIRGFLQDRVWTKTRIESFLSTWQTLPVDQRQSVRDSVEMSRLANAIYKQLLSEKALSDLDNSGQAQENQKLLVNFAREMRIDDPRITLPAETDQE